MRSAMTAGRTRKELWKSLKGLTIFMTRRGINLSEKKVTVRQEGKEDKVIDAPEAVSYTHLDVYKRQVQITCIRIRPKRITSGSEE